MVQLKMRNVDLLTRINGLVDTGCIEPAILVVTLILCQNLLWNITSVCRYY